MKRSILPVLFLWLPAITSCLGSKLDQKINSKPVAAQYTGGHHYYISLVLYKDSTFFYVIAPDFFPAPQTRRKGTYLMDSASVTLRGKRRWNSFWKKPRPQTFRRHGDEVLMYSQDDEQGDNADFMKAYYTLTLEK